MKRILLIAVPLFVALIFFASPAHAQTIASPAASPSGSQVRNIGAGLLGAALIGGGLWWWRRSKLEKSEDTIGLISEPGPQEIHDQDTELDRLNPSGCGCGKEYMGVQDELIQWAKANATGRKTEPEQ
jgi:hypothetical protein